MELEIFKARASGAGVLLSRPRSKKDQEAGKLSLTAQTLVQDWYKERIYLKRKNIYSRYLEKGTVVERDSLIWMAQYLKLGMILETNENQFEDEYFTGTPDLILEDEVIDIKNSWDSSTFPLFETEIKNKLYEVQLQIYMHLTGKKKARLVYLLTNTPQDLISKEIGYKIRDIEKLGRKLTRDDITIIGQDVQRDHSYDQTVQNLHWDV